MLTWKFSKQLISNPPRIHWYPLQLLYDQNKKEWEVPNIIKVVLKATKLKNEGSFVRWIKALNMMLQHLDSTKYYRVKKWLFGSRDTISLRKDYNKKNG
jgi:hypothetical protein